MASQFQSVTEIDLASATGQPAISLAGVVGPEGQVFVTDLAPKMIHMTEFNSKELGIGNMNFRVADAESLLFPDEDFDLVTCRFGVMFFPEVH